MSPPISNLATLAAASIEAPSFWDFDLGLVGMLLMGAGVVVAMTGIRAIIKARHREQFGYGMLLHGLSMLAAVAIGLFAHFMSEWGSLQPLALLGVSDPSLVAGDRMFMAKGDMLTCGVVFLGALLGGIATLRMAGNLGPRPTTE